MNYFVQEIVRQVQLDQVRESVEGVSVDLAEATVSDRDALQVDQLKPVDGVQGISQCLSQSCEVRKKSANFALKRILGVKVVSETLSCNVIDMTRLQLLILSLSSHTVVPHGRLALKWCGFGPFLTPFLGKIC